MICRQWGRQRKIAEQVAGARESEHDQRSIASGLYHVTSAVLLAWEASRMHDNWRRLALAHLVIMHKLLPSDPLAPPGCDVTVLQALLSETPMSRDQASRLLTHE